MCVKIGGVQKFSLLDFPDKISAIIFTAGCNFHCGYCHNPELFSSQSEWDEKKVLEFLKSREGKLDGVVVTGGEPTIHKDLPEFIRKIKSLGFLVKLDTNGTNSLMLKSLIDLKMVDYVAMDIKGPLYKYKMITGVEPAGVEESINILLKNNIPYEFRTTALALQLDIKDFEEIGKLISGADKYFVQKFVPSKILNPKLLADRGYTNAEINSIISVLHKYIKSVGIR